MIDNGNTEHLDKAVKMFLRKSDIDPEKLAQLIEKVSEYAFMHNSKIVFTEKANALPLKKRIILYALAKQLAWKLREIEKYSSEINIDSPYISIRELSESLKTKPNIIGARLSELKNFLAPVSGSKGVYELVVDPEKALLYIEESKIIKMVLDKNG